MCIVKPMKKNMKFYLGIPCTAEILSLLQRHIFKSLFIFKNYWYKFRRSSLNGFTRNKKSNTCPYDFFHTIYCIGKSGLRTRSILTSNLSASLTLS